MSCLTNKLCCYYYYILSESGAESEECVESLENTIYDFYQTPINYTEYPPPSCMKYDVSVDLKRIRIGLKNVGARREMVGRNG